jgi:endonuclease/exonuclease/phosphatase family metal-dependent hydrolase
MAGTALRVLTWNLFHGRAVPGAGRDLFDEFASALESWEWDVALLQEVPPWWPAPLAARLGADHGLVLTSRNALLPLRRAVAVRWPDLIKSNGGGSNAILVRGGSIEEHRVVRLGWLKERRWMHAVRVARGTAVAGSWAGNPARGSGARGWVGNLHTNSDARQGRRAAHELLRWAAGAPTVLGGDFNVSPLSLPGFNLAGGHGVDQVFVSGGLAGARTAVLDRGPLSDHVPVLVCVSRFP